MLMDLFDMKKQDSIAKLLGTSRGDAHKFIQEVNTALQDALMARTSAGRILHTLKKWWSPSWVLVGQLR